MSATLRFLITVEPSAEGAKVNRGAAGVFMKAKIESVLREVYGDRVKVEPIDGLTKDEARG